jgi:hypothetical protein
MAQNSEAKALKIQEYAANGDAKTAQDIKAEFLWLIDNRSRSKPARLSG